MSSNKSYLFRKLYAARLLISELVIKDLNSELFSIKNKLFYMFNPRKYPMNPKQVRVTDPYNKVADVILMIPGMGGDASRFLSLSERIHESQLPCSMFTVDYYQRRHDPVPTREVIEVLDRVKEKCLKQGVELGRIAMIGDSLGALIASKFIWRVNKNFSVPLLISIAGRQRFIENDFAFFCEDIRSEIEKTYQHIQIEPKKAALHTIYGEMDDLVPKQSIHVEEAQVRVTVEGSHQGTLYAAETEAYVLHWINKWVNERFVQSL